MVLNACSKTPTFVRKQNRGPVAPHPRTLNVEKFAEARGSELESLHSILSDRLNNDFRSRRNKRRRTTGYDNRVANKGRKRRKLGDGMAGKTESNVAKDKIPRHIRRKTELKKNPETGFCTSGDETKRLRTHVWHAKRFTMTKLWGFHLPQCLHGKGKGSRVILKRFGSGSLVHDASYHSTVQLEGPEDSLLAVLEMVLKPAPSVLSKDRLQLLLSGAMYGNAMLHGVGAHASLTVSPVTYMWQPIRQQNTSVDIDRPTPDGVECHSFRKMWVWVHASAFSEGYDALKFACEEQTKTNGIPINSSSRQGELAKIEIMGSKSFQLLQKILQPGTGFSDKSPGLNKCSAVEDDIENHTRKYSVLESEERIPSHAIMSLTVDDPRLSHKTRSSEDAMDETNPSHIPSSVPEDEIGKKNTLLTKTTPNKEQELVLPLPLKQEDVSNSALWDTGNVITPHIEEKFLCMEKHHQRLDSLCLGNLISGSPNYSSETKSSRSCPIMLLRDTNLNGPYIGREHLFVSPRGTMVVHYSSSKLVKAFWIPLVSNGGHAIGLTEKRWIATDLGLPTFPSDFADSNAYTSLKETKTAASDKTAESKPLIKRPLRVPILPPWSCVRLAFEEGFTRVVDSHSSEAITSPEQQHGLPFEGFVARTSNMLTDLCNEICGNHLLLFPFASDRKMSSYKITTDESSNTPLNKDRKLCFLRVVLHAFKEGVFEEGSVVCAPQPNDIRLWISGSENNFEGLHVPQTALSSYFTEQDCGIWKYNIPDDNALKESHRWPIGFVTSGFVQGSKKPKAVALCEATLLSRIREEQWKEMPGKKRRNEIFMLVRNLRSAVYRLARATIVLEQQGEDLEFM